MIILDGDWNGKGLDEGFVLEPGELRGEADAVAIVAGEVEDFAELWGVELALQGGGVELSGEVSGQLAGSDEESGQGHVPGERSAERRSTETVGEGIAFVAGSLEVGIIGRDLAFSAEGFVLQASKLFPWLDYSVEDSAVVGQDAAAIRYRVDGLGNYYQ